MTHIGSLSSPGRALAACRAGQQGLPCWRRQWVFLPVRPRPASHVRGLVRPLCKSASAPTTSGAPPPQYKYSAYDDDLKEKSRHYRRTVFTFEAWEDHRSTSRYYRHMKSMLSSRMVRGLIRPLFYVVGVATAVCLYESSLQAGLLPLEFPDLELHSKEPFGLTSFALSLLLVFRTNSSYARWLTARKTWGLVLNRSRDLVRQGLTWIPASRPDLRDMLCRWVPAFSRSLMCHVRKGGNVEKELQGVLLPHEIDAVLQASHHPNFVLQVLSQIVESANVPIPGAMRMDENLTTFEDCLGTCERILKTPIPLSYTRHTSRFMILWLTLLPFMLFEQCGWATVPLCVLIAFLLLGIEEIGVSIEEPFSILALEAICDSALSNARELQAMHSVHSTAAGENDNQGSIGKGSGGHARKRLSALQLVQLAAPGSEVGSPVNH